MPTFESLSKTTELEAVNAMFEAIGEEPIAQGELDSPTLAETTAAINVLTDVMREVQGEGWRFNMEWGYEIEPDGGSPYTVTLRDGDTNDVNVFEPPSDLIAWRPSKVEGQQHDKNVDAQIRPDTLGGAFAEKDVFWDREENIGAWDEDAHPFFYIDYIRFVDFEDMPQVARDYIVRRAARRFANVMVGDANSAQFTRLDERVARRNLERQQGRNERPPNMFRDSAESRAALGWPRTPEVLGSLDDRDSQHLQ